LIITAVFFFRSLISGPPKKKIDNSMIKCDSCETYTHESLIVKKLGRNYCSESCSST
jgi:formylmethanofuran dehydrogenase subunit E